LCLIGSAPDFAPLAAGPVASLLLGVVAAISGLHLILDRPALARDCVRLAALAVLVMWTLIYRRAAPAQRPGLRMAYMLSIQGMLYFVFYQQTATSLTLFALRAVRGDVTLGGVTLFHMSAGRSRPLTRSGS
jgi:POT family proton-dependent oligopeptide transporter